MKLNCKVGDLAVIVRCPSGNKDRIVRVVRYYGHAHFKSGAEYFDCWLVEGRLKTFSGAAFDEFARQLGADGCFSDSALRPIRNQPGNEHWVTESRKSLPRSKDTVTIDERGEVQA